MMLRVRDLSVLSSNSSERSVEEKFNASQAFTQPIKLAKRRQRGRPRGQGQENQDINNNRIMEEGGVMLIFRL